MAAENPGPAPAEERPPLPPAVKAWLFADMTDKGVRARASALLEALVQRSQTLPPRCGQIAYARSASRVTQVELAATLHTGQPAIARLESGLTQAPTARTLARIAEATRAVFFIGPGVVADDPPKRKRKPTKKPRRRR